jgi:hypothetical protein
MADAASIASGRNWLLASGQLRASEAGSGFGIAQRSFADGRREGCDEPNP